MKIKRWLAVVLIMCLVMSATISTYASNEKSTYTIQAECNEGGRLSPSGRKAFSAGQSQTYTITPDYGYVIKDVFVDGESKGAMTTYTFHNMDSNHSIEVVFGRRSSDLNENGICDAEDIVAVRDYLLEADANDEVIDTNGDSEMNIMDYVRTLRQETLWGNTLDDMNKWTNYSSDVLQVSGTTASFNGSTSALSAENFGSNYSVSATFMFSGNAGGKTSSFGLMARRIKNTYYDFRLFYMDGAFEIRLQRYGSDGNVTRIATYTELFIQNTIGYQALAFNKPIQMRITCQDNYVYCYVDDCLLGVYEDLDETAPKTGSAGVKISNAVGSFSGFEVQSTTAISIEQVNSDTMNQKKLELYEGGSLYQSMETIQGVCIDGTILTSDMQHAEISEYDSKIIGEQQLTMSLLGNEIPVTLKVKGRRTEIATISSALENHVTDEVLRQYNALSEYEKTLCSKKAVENYQKAVKERAIALTSAEDELLLWDSYDGNQVKWNSGVEVRRGKSFADEGRYCIEQTAYGMSGNCWRTVEDFYGEIHSVSADMMATSVYTATGLTMNVSDQGYYYARVLFGVGDDGNELSPTVRLFRRVSDTVLLEKVTLSNHGIHLSPEEWFHMSMTCEDGVLCVYINGTKLIEYDDSNSVEKHYFGSAGVYSYAGNSKFDNFVVCGKKVAQTESPMKPIATSYENDFEQAKAGNTQTDWMHSNEELAWKVVRGSDNNQYYGVKATEYTDAKLHVHEKNPTVSFDFMYDELDDADAKFGVEIRQSGETAYVRISYDKAAEKWYLKESTCDVECDVFEYDATNNVSENVWHTANIVADGDAVLFEVDGQTIFDLTGITQTDFGRIAFYAEGTEFYIDNISCKFPSGDVVQSGIIEYYLNDYDNYAAAFEIESLDGANMIGVGYNVIALSDDYGKTFTKVTDEAYADLDANGAYSSMIQLHDGNYLFVKQTDFKILRSEGDMTAWKHIGTVIEQSNLKDSFGRKRSIVHVNSLTEVQLQDGTWRIFLPVGISLYENDYSTDVKDHYTEIYYSDDGGVTWSCSENDTRDVATLLPEGQTNADWCEIKVIKCSDGSLRMYCSRNEYGSMLYSVSEDGGVTWGRMQVIPELQCAKSSFSIIEDGAGSGVYYMVWVNDNPNIVGSLVGRGRISLARSTDGMNWEFLCDIERNSSYVWSNDITVTSPIFQIVDPSIEVTDDYVYVSYGTSDKTLEYGNEYHNAQEIKIVRVEKDKLKAREWNAYTLSNPSYVCNASMVIQMDTTFLVGEEFSYSGGTIQLFSLDGTKKLVNSTDFYLLEEPDMTTEGVKEIVLYNRNGITVRYNITVGKPMWGEIF